MAFTQTDLDRVDSAIAKGELRVTFADRTVEYRSISELKEARELILQQISTTARSKQSFGVSSNGF